MSELLRPRGAPTPPSSGALNSDTRHRLNWLEQRLIPGDDDRWGCLMAASNGYQYSGATAGPWVPFVSAVTFRMIIVTSGSDGWGPPNPTVTVLIQKNGVQVASLSAGRNAVSLPFLPRDKLTFKAPVTAQTLWSRVSVQAFFTGAALSAGLLFDYGGY